SLRRGALPSRPIGAGAAEAAESPGAPATFSFAQISDTHIGFKGEANRDALATFEAAVARIRTLDPKPALLLPTRATPHTQKAGPFDIAREGLRSAGVERTFYVPGEHDVYADGGAEYLSRCATGRPGRGWQSFDHGGVHFVGLVNVLTYKAGGLGNLGAEQLEWLERDVAGLASSTPIVVFAHVPLWAVYPQWGWVTDDAAQALGYLRRFGSVTVLNGHIHQIMQKVEGNVTFHTARSTAFPQPAPGTAPSPGPMKVPAETLRDVLGIREVTYAPGRDRLAVVDASLASRALEAEEQQEAGGGEEVAGRVRQHSGQEAAGALVAERPDHAAPGDGGEALDPVAVGDAEDGGAQQRGAPAGQEEAEGGEEQPAEGQLLEDRGPHDAIERAGGHGGGRAPEEFLEESVGPVRGDAEGAEAQGEQALAHDRQRKQHEAPRDQAKRRTRRRIEAQAERAAHRLAAGVQVAPRPPQHGEAADHAHDRGPRRSAGQQHHDHRRNEQIGERGPEEETQTVRDAARRRQRRARDPGAVPPAQEPPQHDRAHHEEQHAGDGEQPHPHEERVPARLDAGLRVGLQGRVVDPGGDAAQERVGEPVAGQLAADLLCHGR